MEFDRYDYGNGRFGLLFAPPRIDAFRESGLSGSGHDWERLLVQVLPRLAPRALAGTVFDCESDLFVAINADPNRLSELEAAITEITADERTLRACIKQHGKRA